LIALSPSNRPPVAPDEEDEVDAAIKRNPCYSGIKALEDCLLRTDRNFMKCQKEIKDLQACNKKASSTK